MGLRVSPVWSTSESTASRGAWATLQSSSTSISAVQPSNCIYISAAAFDTRKSLESEEIKISRGFHILAFIEGGKMITHGFLSRVEKGALMYRRQRSDLARSVVVYCPLLFVGCMSATAAGSLFSHSRRFWRQNRKGNTEKGTTHHWSVYVCVDIHIRAAVIPK